MAENAAYAVNSKSSLLKKEQSDEKLYTLIAKTFATALLEGLNYVGYSIFNAIPKILNFFILIDSIKMAKNNMDFL